MGSDVAAGGRCVPAAVKKRWWCSCCDCRRRRRCFCASPYYERRKVWRCFSEARIGARRVGVFGGARCCCLLLSSVLASVLGRHSFFLLLLVGVPHVYLRLLCFICQKLTLLLLLPPFFSRCKHSRRPRPRRHLLRPFPRLLRHQQKVAWVSSPRLLLFQL